MRGETMPAKILRKGTKIRLLKDICHAYETFRKGTKAKIVDVYKIPGYPPKTIIWDDGRKMEAPVVFRKDKEFEVVK